MKSLSTRSTSVASNIQAVTASHMSYGKTLQSLLNSSKKYNHIKILRNGERF